VTGLLMKTEYTPDFLQIIGFD